MAAEDGSRDLVTADVILPSSKVDLSHLSSNLSELQLFIQVYLPPRDDAAEFDDGGVDLAGHQDDREVVQWRKSNKVELDLTSLDSKTLFLEGWAAAGCDSQRGRQGGRWFWHPVPVHQHCLRSWYLKKYFSLNTIDFLASTTSTPTLSSLLVFT